METFYSIILNLDAIIYTFINYLFNVFLLLSRATIFTEETVAPLIRRIYTLIGVVMLFILSYSLLKSIVTPDSSKDKESPGKMIFSIVKCIILLALVPTIFTFAFNVQNSILKANTIGKVILGTEECSGTNCKNSKLIDSGGMEMATGIFDAFLFPTDQTKEESAVIINTEKNINFAQAKNSIKENENFFFLDNLSKAVDDGVLTYYWGVSSIAGFLVLYMLFSYCLSLGFRVIKIAFYEVMAPVCIIASILPSQKDMLSKWIKATIQTFLEVFIRIAILYFSVYLITAVKEAFAGGLIKNVGGVGEGLAKCLIIMGIVMFMKQAPELISNITGMDKKNMGLGIKEKLAAGGFFTAGAIAGGALIGASRNIFGNIAKGAHNAKKNWKRYEEESSNPLYSKREKRKMRNQALRQGFGSVVGGLGKGVISGVFGGISGGFHSFDGETKDFKTMGSAAKKGYETAGNNAINRADYRAKHSTGSGFISDMINVGVGHIKDFGNSALKMAGVGTIENLKIENAKMERITSAKDTMDDSVEAWILKRLGKGDTVVDLTSFGGSNVDITVIKDKKNNLENARATGGDVIGAEGEYKKALKNVQLQIENAMLSSKAVWEKQTNDTKSKFADLRVNAVNFKGEIRNNASIEAIVDAKINGADLSDAVDFKIGVMDASGNYDTVETIDKMEKLIKIYKGNNAIKIASAKQNEDANKDKK